MVASPHEVFCAARSITRAGTCGIDSTVRTLPRLLSTPISHPIRAAHALDVPREQPRWMRKARVRLWQGEGGKIETTWIQDVRVRSSLRHSPASGGRRRPCEARATHGESNSGEKGRIPISRASSRCCVIHAFDSRSLDEMAYFHRPVACHRIFDLIFNIRGGFRFAPPRRVSLPHPFLDLCSYDAFKPHTCVGFSSRFLIAALVLLIANPRNDTLQQMGRYLAVTHRPSAPNVQVFIIHTPRTQPLHCCLFPNSVLRAPPAARVQHQFNSLLAGKFTIFSTDRPINVEGCSMASTTVALKREDENHISTRSAAHSTHVCHHGHITTRKQPPKRKQLRPPQDRPAFDGLPGGLPLFPSKDHPSSSPHLLGRDGGMGSPTVSPSRGKQTTYAAILGPEDLHELPMSTVGGRPTMALPLKPLPTVRTVKAGIFLPTRLRYLVRGHSWFSA